MLKMKLARLGLISMLLCSNSPLLFAQKGMDQIMPIRLTPKDTIGGSFTRRQTLPVVAAPSFWALTG